MATNSIRLDQLLAEKATIMAKAYNRTPPKQIESINFYSVLSMKRDYFFGGTKIGYLILAVFK
jgi:hypothetical protein